MGIGTNRKLILVVVAIVIVGGSSCSSAGSSAEEILAEAAVTQFHRQYNAGQFHEIYSQADEALKDYRKETDFVAMLEAMSHKLGSVNQSNRGRSRATTIGVMVILTCDVEFTKGKGTEKFVFLISGDKATLNNYSVDSPLF